MADLHHIKNFCNQHGLSFEIQYAEFDSSWTIHLHGAGSGEDFIVKNIGTLEEAIKFVVKDAREFYERLKNG